MYYVSEEIAQEVLGRGYVLKVYDHTKKRGRPSDKPYKVYIINEGTEENDYDDVFSLVVKY